jgi:Leucine-rich repeat (LRR) protein
MELPKEIGSLKKLQKLVVRDNSLEKIPLEIGKCQELVHLNLQGNKLKTLPIQITTTNLGKKHALLLLAGNPLLKCVKNHLKNGGVAKLLVAMQDPKWEETVQDEIVTLK